MISGPWASATVKFTIVRSAQKGRTHINQAPALFSTPLAGVTSSN